MTKFVIFNQLRIGVFEVFNRNPFERWFVGSVPTNIISISRKKLFSVTLAFSPFGIIAVHSLSSKDQKWIIQNEYKDFLKQAEGEWNKYTSPAISFWVNYYSFWMWDKLLKKVRKKKCKPIIHSAYLVNR